MFYDIKELERERYAEKFKNPIRTEIIDDNYYRFVLRDWFNFKKNKFQLNDLWHSFLVCYDTRLTPENTFLILPIKNIKYNGITFNGIKSKQHLYAHKYTLMVTYTCIYNKWLKEDMSLSYFLKSPRNILRASRPFIIGVEEDNKLEQIYKC